MEQVQPSLTLPQPSLIVRWKRFSSINPHYLNYHSYVLLHTTSTPLTAITHSTLPQPSLTAPLHTISTIAHITLTIIHNTSTISTLPNHHLQYLYHFHTTSTITHTTSTISTVPQASLTPRPSPHYINHHSQCDLHTTSIIAHMEASTLP